MATMLLIGLALLGGSVLLLVLEAFLPTHGVLGLGAIVMALAGIVVLFRHDVTWGLVGMLTTMVLGPIAFFWMLKILPATPVGRVMMGDPVEEVTDAQRRAADADRAASVSLLDAQGLALTDLRPVGTVEIDGARYEALALGQAIDRGTRVRVVDADRTRITVRPVRTV